MKAPIHSRKHIVQTTLSSILTGTTLNTVLAQGVSVANKNVPTEVEEGAIVKAINVEMWGLSSSADGFHIAVISKQPQDNSGPLHADMLALDTYNNKKNIFYTQQGLSSNDGVGNPMVIHNGWLAIPKSKQRIGLGDILSITIANPSANTFKICGKTLYKEYL